MTISLRSSPTDAAIQINGTDAIVIDSARNVNALIGLLSAGSAVQTLANFTGANQQLAASGFQNFPGGLKLKWGTISSAANGSAAVTFPTAFPTACIFASGFIVNNGVAPAAVVNSTPNVNGFGFTAFLTTTGAGSAQPCYWIALGF